MSSSFIRSLFKRTKSKVKTNKPAAPPMLGSFVETIVQGISTSTADNYHTAVRSFLSFNKGKDIALSGMTDDKVRRTCIQIYERLQELHKTHNYETVIVPQPKLKTTKNIDETDVNDTQKND